MHNVAFFSNHFASSNGTGIARYARNFVKASAACGPPFTVIPVATRSSKEHRQVGAHNGAATLKLLPTGRWLTPALWLSIGLPRLEQLLDIPIDIVHAAYLGYPAATSRPYVVTVHDIGPLAYPHYFSDGAPWFLKKHLKQAIDQNAAFVCVSQATADSLLEYVQAQYARDLSARTHVVYEGISEQFLQPPPVSPLSADRPSAVPQPFILAVGKISPRKNLEAVLKALSSVQSVIPHHLVAVGGDGWDFKGIRALVNTLGLARRVHFLGYVSDEMLNALYRQAALFVYPSLFEGFGLPVLEAMAAGCPVITSNVSSLPEVVGDAALLVNPHDSEELAAALEALCLRQDLARELRNKGHARVKQFSWTKCAQETQRVYERLSPSLKSYI